MFKKAIIRSTGVVITPSSYRSANEFRDDIDLCIACGVNIVKLGGTSPKRRKSSEKIDHNQRYAEHLRRTCKKSLQVQSTLKHRERGVIYGN